ncbi:outer membrane assembly protein [Formosa agariphila KMM 3901]|uniref:Outer membrane assembly protein n=1 Tax=Formosa agariphila (strain DSM 15362 / KCTC 12365 / LMG 23005 / KMM 3901 / M-2Alg 35-1) TaxID=1347342 RepID=T2KGD6_FORAG|nr:AsmA-like C-terminal region-containing protein [Formosa agariphila]CDF77842.1 outer membrane assembly protein [Formosa agariphila KMM 3901]
MKKTLKIIGIVIGILLVFLIAAPFLFEGKILDIVKSTVNKNIDAEFDFADADVSFIRNFPEVSVSINDMSILNTGTFAGETLVSAKNANVSVPFMQIFNSADESYTINTFSIDGAIVNVLIDKDGNVNYDIAKKDGTKTTEAVSEAPASNVSLSIQKYEITNSQIKYHDEQGKMYFELNDFNHSGTGDLSAVKSELDTKTSGLISFDMDETNYFKDTPIQLDAKLGIDLEQNSYTFLENKAIINQLELVFDGSVKLNEVSQDVDLTFKTPSSDFKNFLALIPEAYSKDIENVETTGDFVVQGTVNGTIDEAHIPAFNIGITSNNASFKYPDLPQSVSNITIDTKIANDTGILEHTYVNINTLTFKIAQDVFSANATIKELMGNPLVNANLKGRINLGNLSQAYPFEVEQQLQGILDANIATAFDMKAIEDGRYQDTKNSGSLGLSGFEFNSEDMKSPIQISKAGLTFNTQNVTLNTFDAKTGRTDLSAKGTIDNLLGFMFNDQMLKGNFTLNSNTFAVNDFMTENETPDNTESVEPTENTKAEVATVEQIKIPAFLDATIVANANTVLYDNLTLKDASATLFVKDETVTLKDFKSNIFGGQIALNGAVSTKADTPTFDVKLGMKSFDIAESFNGLELLQALAPVAKAMQGVLNSNFEIHGDLGNDFTPNLNTISGTALAEVLVTNFITEESKVLSTLVNRLEFLNFDAGETKKLNTTLTFKDGQVQVKPFDFKVKDISVEVSGSHGFDQSINYNAMFDVPAKYLGKEAQNLLAKLDDAESKNITVPVSAKIGGSVGSPSITTDLSATATALTNKLVEMQKDKLLNEGSKKVTDALNSFLGGNTSKDSTSTNSATQSKDSVTTDNIKKAADKLLNGLFGSKKE